MEPEEIEEKMYTIKFEVQSSDEKLVKDVFRTMQYKWADVWREMNLHSKNFGNVRESLVDAEGTEIREVE